MPLLMVTGYYATIPVRETPKVYTQVDFVIPRRVFGSLTRRVAVFPAPF